jgi:hypothetical protein
MRLVQIRRRKIGRNPPRPAGAGPFAPLSQRGRAICIHDLAA